MLGTGGDDFICRHCGSVILEDFDPSTVRGNPVYHRGICGNNTFCNGSGRVITSFGPLVAGLLVVQLGGLSNATGIMTSFVALSIVAVLLGRETRDEQLPL